MGMFDGVLLSCDIDGTIMTGGVIPQKNIDAIEAFKKEGGMVCLATGRTAPAMNPVLSQYNGYCPCVVGNGSMIFDPVGGEILYERWLLDSEFDCVIRALNADKNVGIEIHSGKTIYKLTETEETKVHQQYEQIAAKPITLEQARKLKINKVLYLFDDEAQKEKIKKAVIPYGKKSAFCDTKVMIYGKMRLYLEHMPSGITKSSTLLKLLDIIGSSKDKFYAIGDGYNDLEMLKTASFCACPDNSPEEVKAAVRECNGIIVGNVRDGAVADFIEIIKRRINNGCKNKT